MNSSTKTTPQMPVLGAEGDICSACQAPLAIDQRYCLQCGHRRGASRVDFAELLPLGTGEGAVTTTTTTDSGGIGRSPTAQGAWTPFAMVASIAVLALMLLVGVMIGKDDGPQQQVVAAAPVAPTEAAATGTESGTQTASGSESSGSAGGGDEGGGSQGGGGGEDGIEENPPPAESADGAEVVDDAALDDLAAKSPEDYAEASKNLPDTIALPGEPPPTDNEEPGGGSDAEVIE